MIGDTTLAGDVFQDVCVTVCRTLRDLRDPALFAPWAYRIGHRQALRAITRRRLWQTLEVEPAVGVTDEPGRDEEIALATDADSPEALLNFLFGAAAVELVFIATFLLLADFSNRLHVLLFLSTITVYTTLGLGLIVLAIRMDGSLRRIVSAIDAGVSKP